MKFTVSPAPGNRNSYKGRHWGRYSREKKRINTEIGWQCLQMKRKPSTPVVVHLRRVGWNLMDEPGVWESVKPVLDALVSHGVIPDDSPRYLSCGTVEQEIDRRKDQVSRLEVRLEETAEWRGEPSTATTERKE